MVLVDYLRISLGLCFQFGVTPFFLEWFLSQICLVIIAFYLMDLMLSFHVLFSFVNDFIDFGWTSTGMRMLKIFAISLIMLKDISLIQSIKL